MMAATNLRKSGTTNGSHLDWLSPNEAARLLGIHRQTVMRLVMVGELVGEARGKFTFITRESVERALATQGK